MEDTTQTTPEPEEIPVEASEAEEPAVDYKDKWQRAVADLENARKRFEVERMAAIKYGSQSLIEELLPTVDNFYRATEHIPAEQQGSPWVAGIQYIQKNLLDVLESRGLSEIAAKVGDDFNPSLHESVELVESDPLPDDKVAEVRGKGYRLHDKLLRPVRVAVSKAK